MFFIHFFLGGDGVSLFVNMFGIGAGELTSYLRLDDQIDLITEQNYW